MDTTNGSLDTLAGSKQAAACGNATAASVASPAMREGMSEKSPVVISAATPMAGVPAEYAWLTRNFGALGQDWKVDLRSLCRNEQGRTIETFRLVLKGGAKTDVHFDITQFHQL